jgi:uncharacterized damage-inducible protein DinB
MSLAQPLVAEFDSEAANTRKVFARLPDSKFAFRPHPKSMEAGALASHLATILFWGVTVLKEREFDVAPGGELRPSIGYKSSAELLAAFDKNAAGFRTALAGASDEELRAKWALKKNGQVVFELPRAAVLRPMIFQHTVHHRAQLGLYLRLLDIAVPSIYGPTADEA